MSIVRIITYTMTINHFMNYSKNMYLSIYIFFSVYSSIAIFRFTKFSLSRDIFNLGNLRYQAESKFRTDHVTHKRPKKCCIEITKKAKYSDKSTQNDFRTSNKIFCSIDT